ncbi:MAG: alpha/beta hydrolase [Proteobacteria bacterium]|nr:alpha/beta hydrolase [Pseudomonadota bacterium]MBU1452257.1 alpha/beta hydrolase [Pseudomonadota bacterium]MBU2467182.1 alpha/beta hydrolase [Pseudomonadota bacterium]MBU2518134.1 alpha/beta hydrolase [Pseudomonadota bacterium]
MPEANVGDITLYYEIHGQGRPLVMIRGLGSNADHWYGQVPALSERYQVVVFDNRGVARSSDPGGPLSVRQMAGDTLGLLDALGLESPLVFGLSMGGMIAQELAINHSQRLSGLVLACTHPGGPHQVRPTAEVEALFKDMVYLATPEAKRAAAPTLFDPKTLEQRPQVAAEYAEVSLRHPAGADILTRQWNAVLGHDTYDRLPQIQAPTLVLTGDADVLIPPGNSEILAQRIPGAKLAVIPGGGHQILVEQPAPCNQAVLAFLGDLDD